MLKEWSWVQGINENWTLQSPFQLGVFPFAYESRRGLTDSRHFFPDSLVFTHKSEDNEIFGGDHKPNPELDHSLYCFPLLSNQTKGNQNLYHRIAVTSELTPSWFFFFCYFRSCSSSLTRIQSSNTWSPTPKEALSLAIRLLVNRPLTCHYTCVELN